MSANTTAAARIRDLWPSIRELIHPLRWVLAAGIGLMLVNRLCGLVLPVSSKYLIDDVLVPRRADRLELLVLVVLAATLIQGCTSFALTHLLTTASQKLVADLRMKVQAHIGRLPVSYYDEHKTGSLVSRIMSDVEQIRNIMSSGIIEFAGSVVTSVIVVVMLVQTSVTMTAAALISMLGFVVVLQRTMRVLGPIHRERSRLNAEVTGRLSESLSGVRVVKGYHAEAREREVFANGVRRLFEQSCKSLWATGLLGLSATAITGFVSALIMYLGARQVFAGQLMLGDFVKYATLLTFLVAPVFQIVHLGTQISEAFAGLERTREVLRERPEDEDPRRTVTLPPRITGRVEFDRVHFYYTEGRCVLRDVSLVAEPGTVTALVGPSGSGKSTIIGLAAAFQSPHSGVVRVDGVDLSTARLESYRTQLGIVLQEAFLFEGTIRDNVAFARPQASEAEILDACRIARVDEFAERFADGYGTVVGERGVKLSGGQRQRVSIARAILARPRILILDEATSNLDSESEALIQEGMRYLMEGRTTFVIAHRISTIRHATQILVVEDGCIVERGRHDDLYEARGRYWSFYTRQHGHRSAELVAAAGSHI